MRQRILGTVDTVLQALADGAMWVFFKQCGLRF